MEQMTIPASRRLQARQAYGRAADAFDSVAWRPPTASRFDARPANDPDMAFETPEAKPYRALPAWATVALGGAVAAALGALMGVILGL